MTLFGSAYFFYITILLMLPAIILGCMERQQKYYGFAISLLMVYLAMAHHPKAMFYMALYCGLELVLVKAYLWLCNKGYKSLWLYYLFLVLSLSPLTMWKIESFIGTGYGLFAFMGLSYMSFKSIQMIIEIYDGLITEVRVFDFLYFLIFFPSLLSGPIARSREFQKDILAPKCKALYLEQVGDGLFKVCLGLVYKFVIAAPLYQQLLLLEAKEAAIYHWLYMYCYGTYLFFDFAGYSLMAIGVGYFFGIKLPENFNKPFLATDMKDFWNRWHMSLSYWFRDFVFSRFMMKAIKGKWFKNKLTAASIALIINMGVMGVWHGLESQYIMYGLYHGILLALTEVYQKKSRFHKKYKKNKYYKLVSWFITVNLVFFGFFIFSGAFGKMVLK